MFLFSFSIFFLFFLFDSFLLLLCCSCCCLHPPFYLYFTSHKHNEKCVCKEIHVVKYLPSSIWHKKKHKCVFLFGGSVFLYFCSLFSGCHIIKSIHINKTTHYIYLPTIILMLRTWHLKNEQHQQQTTTTYRRRRSKKIILCCTCCSCYIII